MASASIPHHSAFATLTAPAGRCYFGHAAEVLPRRVTAPATGIPLPRCRRGQAAADWSDHPDLPQSGFCARGGQSSDHWGDDRLFGCGQFEFERAVLLVKAHLLGRTAMPGELARLHVVVASIAVVDVDLPHPRPLLR